MMVHSTYNVLTFDEFSVRVGDDSCNLIKAIAISELRFSISAKL